jgi:hypothetical protein
MVTTTTESMELIGILLRYLSKRKALKMLTDMEEEVANTTENISLRDSIKMVRSYLK